LLVVLAFPVLFASTEPEYEAVNKVKHMIPDINLFINPGPPSKQ